MTTKDNRIFVFFMRVCILQLVVDEESSTMSPNMEAFSTRELYYTQRLGPPRQAIHNATPKPQGGRADPEPVRWPEWPPPWDFAA